MNRDRPVLVELQRRVERARARHRRAVDGHIAAQQELRAANAEHNRAIDELRAAILPAKERA